MKWISVKERLPKKNKLLAVSITPCICNICEEKDKESYCKSAIYDGNTFNILEESGVIFIRNRYHITHWAEIEPPKDEEWK